MIVVLVFGSVDSNNTDVEVNETFVSQGLESNVTSSSHMPIRFDSSVKMSTTSPHRFNGYISASWLIGFAVFGSVSVLGVLLTVKLALCDRYAGSIVCQTHEV